MLIKLDEVQFLESEVANDLTFADGINQQTENRTLVDKDGNIPNAKAALMSDLIGTVVGAAIWSVLQNGLQFAQAPVAIRNIIIGIIVIVAVLLDIIIRRGPVTKKKTNKSKN